MLYAAGELAGDDAAEFEARLADDPTAQDALVRAVQLTALFAGTPDRPDPAYRSAVRARLRPRRIRRYWAAPVAAAAAVFALFLVPDRTGHVPTPALPEPVAAVVEEPPALAGDLGPDDQQAEVWADLSNPDHVRRAHDQQMRRRTRQEDRPGTRLALLRPGRPLIPAGRDARR
jgi:hypothetical protein